MLNENEKSNVYYEQVAESLVNKINAGIYKYGDRIPSERELCNTYSVSRTTVRKAIEELVYSGYLVKQQGKGTFIAKDIPEIEESSRKNTGNILFVRCIHSNDKKISLAEEDIFYPQILTGIEDAATKNAYHCIFKNIDENRIELNKIDELIEKIDGVVWGGELHNDYLLDHLIASKIPLVLISPSIRVDNVDSVDIDNEFGAYKGVKYLIENGHQKIAYIGGYEDSFPSSERKRGYIEALKEAGIEFNVNLTISNGWRYEDGYNSMINLMERECEFTALFAASDLLAIGAINAMREYNLSIPEDISVIGFDDVSISSQMKPGLTTIKVLKNEMGKVAADLLFERLAGKRDYQLNVSLPTELIERESVLKLSR